MQSSRPVHQSSQVIGPLTHQGILQTAITPGIASAKIRILLSQCLHGVFINCDKTMIMNSFLSSSHHLHHHYYIIIIIIHIISLLLLSSLLSSSSSLPHRYQHYKCCNCHSVVVIVLSSLCCRHYRHHHWCPCHHHRHHHHHIFLQESITIEHTMARGIIGVDSIPGGCSS